MKRVPLEGRTFENWQVLSYLGNHNKKSYYLCKCLKCGIEKPVRADKLIRGRTKQCGACARKVMKGGVGRYARTGNSRNSNN